MNKQKILSFVSISVLYKQTLFINHIIIVQLFFRECNKSQLVE